MDPLVDSGDQSWFKRAHIGRFLGKARIITSTTKLSEEDIRSRAFLQAERGSIVWTPIGKMCHCKLSRIQA